MPSDWPSSYPVVHPHSTIAEILLDFPSSSVKLCVVPMVGAQRACLPGIYSRQSFGALYVMEGGMDMCVNVWRWRSKEMGQIGGRKGRRKVGRGKKIEGKLKAGGREDERETERVGGNRKHYLQNCSEQWWCSTCMHKSSNTNPYSIQPKLVARLSVNCCDNMLVWRLLGPSLAVKLSPTWCVRHS